MISSLFVRAAFLWLAFHKAPEREFNRLLHEAMDQAKFELVMRELVREIEDDLAEHQD